MVVEPVVVGVKPWLPPPLSGSEWWTAPVAAERLAAVRIGVGATLVADVLGTYLPAVGDLFGDGSVTPPISSPQPWNIAHRMAFMDVGDPLAWKIVLIVWALAGVFLTVGLLTRLSAGVAWFTSMSLIALNPMLHNAGDQVRTILLLTLTVAPSGAIWSLDARRRSPDAKVLVYPWPLRLLFVQMAAIYFMNGIFKLLGPEWRSGDALAILLGDSGWIRWPVADWPIPKLALRLSTWLTLIWELTFLWIVRFPRLQTPMLLFGVAFHMMTWLVMRVGMFPPYMMCLYLMFVPWERFLNSPPSKR